MLRVHALGLTEAEDKNVYNCRCQKGIKSTRNLTDSYPGKLVPGKFSRTQNGKGNL